MTRFLLLLLIGMIPFWSVSQVDKYVTVQFASRSYTINALNDMEERVRKKYTIHSAKAAHEADLTIGYDKFSKITDAEIVYSDHTGLITKKFKLKDFNDQVMQDGYSLFSDNRLKYIKAGINEYPLNIEYSYTIKHKNTLGLHTWQPLDDYHTEVYHTELNINSIPPGLVSVKELNFKGEKTTKDGVITYSTDSIAPIEDEMFSNEDDFPQILLSPSVIEMEGYKGNLKDWYAYGQWVNGLIQDRDVLTPEDQLKIKNMIPAGAGFKTQMEILYRYLQNNTRYVGIQLGIGGFQPMAASEVAKVGYGDCKALSNYM